VTRDNNNNNQYTALCGWLSRSPWSSSPCVWIGCWCLWSWIRWTRLMMLFAATTDFWRLPSDISPFGWWCRVLNWVLERSLRSP
jgi:hypothetical protein